MIKFRPGIYFLLAVSFLFIPFQWWIAWIAASLIHELSHITTLKLCGGRILSIVVGTGGTVIESDCNSELKKLICTLSGPLSGFLFLVLLDVMPRVAICAILQSIYNLLPFEGLDGGRVLKIIIHKMLPDHTAEKTLVFIDCTVSATLLGMALYATVYFNLGIMPILLALFLLIKKSLAKRAISEYNRKDKNTRGYGYGRMYQANFANSTKTCKIYRRRI